MVSHLNVHLITDLLKDCPQRIIVLSLLIKRSVSSCDTRNQYAFFLRVFNANNEWALVFEISSLGINNELS